MLIRTSSGSTSVGHLSHTPHGFSALHRPDTAFSCGCLVFPVPSLLLAASSRFFADFFQVEDSVELLRLAVFLSNVALTAALTGRLAAALQGLGDEALLLVFRAAADLKLRRLVADCLALLLPQFGRCTSEGTVATAIECMDVTLSKAVLTQLAMQGTASLAHSSAAAGTGSSSGGSSPRSPAAVSAPSCRPEGPATPALDVEHVKAQFVRVLEAKGWGQ